VLVSRVPRRSQAGLKEVGTSTDASFGQHLTCRSKERPLDGRSVDTSVAVENAGPLHLHDDNALFWSSTETAVNAISALTEDRLLTADSLNPLSLLASASVDSHPGGQERHGLPLARATFQYLGLPRSKLDVEAGTDPIEMGLITLEEAIQSVH